MSSDLAQVEQLRATLTIMEAAMEIIADGVVWIGQDGAVQWCNSAFVRLVGQLRSSILNSCLSNILPLAQAGYPVVLTCYPDARLRNGTYEPTEYELQQGDKSRVLYISGCCVQRAPDDQIAILTICDLTQSRGIEAEYKHKEAVLRKEEAKYRSIFENATQGIFQSTPDGVCISANLALAKIIGYDSPEELINNITPAEASIYVDPERHHEFLRVLNEQGFVVGFESQIYRKDGTVIWISESAQTVCDEAGQPLYYEGFVEDITERKHAEQAREVSLSLLQATLESTADAILVVNRERNVPIYNQKFLQMWSIPDALLQPGSENERLKFLSEQTIDPNAFIARVWELFRDRPEEEALELLEFKDGRVFERYSQPQWSGDRIIGRVWSFRDVTERRRSEEALRLSELKFRRLFENSQVGIFRTRIEDGLIIDANQRYIELAGYTSPDEVIGKCFSTDFYVDLSDRQRMLSELREFGEVNNFEMRFRQRNGTLRWGLYSIRLNLEENCLEGVFTDITDRRQTEEALRASEAQYRDLIQTANCIILRWDPEGYVRFLNDYGQRFLGFEASEILDRPIVGTIVPETETSGRDLQQLMRNICQDPENYSLNENENLRKNGERVWITWANKPIVDEQGNLIEILSIGTDATERKQAEEALRLNELKYRNIFENSHVGIGRTRLEDGLFLDVNQRCAEIMGYSSAADLVGKRCSTDFYADPLERQQMLAELEQHGEVRDFELSLQQPDGSTRCGLLSLRLNEEDSCLDFVIADISDRKQAEATLRQQQEFLRTVLDTDPNQIFVKDWNGRYLLANKASADFYNLAVEDLIGKQDSDFHPFPEESDRFLKENRQVIETKQELFIPEEKITAGPGQDEWLQWQKRPLKLPGSDTYSVLGIGVNITERKLQEQALRLIVEGTVAKTGNEFFQSCVRYLAEVLRVPYALVTEFHNEAKTRVRTLAAWFETAFGNNFEYDLLGTPCEQVLQGQMCYYTEGLRTLFPDDPHVAEAGIVSYLGIPLADSSGTILGHIAVMDVKPMENNPERELILKIFAARTGAELERKQAEEALRRRAQVDSLLSSVSRCFIDQDLDSAINFTLRAIASLINAERSYIFDYSDNQEQLYITHEWCADDVEPLSADARETSTQRFPQLHSHIVSGNILQIPCVAQLPAESAEKNLFESQSTQSVVIVPMIHADKVLGFLGANVIHYQKIWSQQEVNLLRLVGELIAIGRARHRAEDALRVAKEAAEAASRAKSIFLANMSHELRTPLNAILGFSQLMERDAALTARQRESLGIINRSGEHLLDLINDVLEMSKIEAGRTILNPAPFDLHSLLQIIRDMIQVRADAKHLFLQFDIDPDLPRYVSTDEGKLRQVLLNLLGNAIKFTDSGGITLRVKAEQRTDEAQPESTLCSNSDRQVDIPTYTLRFEVEDTGRGIAADEIETLFQPFVQTMSGAQIREGTGLGLTISRQFVRLMGGDIHLTSTVGEGSTFYFDVQATQTAPLGSTLTLAAGRVVGLAPDQPVYRILAVDDRPENRDLIAQLLGSVGFEIQTAVNGEEAIAQWQRWHPHLIWMDMRMPVLSGYEATRQIRAVETSLAATSPHPKVKIIALTASAFEEQRATILAAGCNDFVRKPFKEQLIFEKLAQHLGVRYIYEEGVDKTKPTGGKGINHSSHPSSSFILHPSSLDVMSIRWIAALHQAALEVDAEQVLQLVEQIPEIHSDLARALEELVDRFCFDEILELTKPPA